MVLGGLLTGLAALLARQGEPGPQVTPSTAPEFAAIALEDVAVISQNNPAAGERVVDIVALLRNPNPRAGVATYQINFSLYDTDGQVIKEASESTYVLPGSIQYVAALNIKLPLERRLGRVAVNLPPEVNFIRLPDNLDLPRFALSLRERQTKTVGNQTLEDQPGVITNSSTFDWQRVEVTAVALDTQGSMIGVGKTFIGKLLVGEQREFTVQWPKPPQAIDQVIALPSTNMFREDNVVDIIGDPGRLR